MAVHCPPLPLGTPGETTPRPVGYPEVSLSSTLKHWSAIPNHPQPLFSRPSGRDGQAITTPNVLVGTS